MTTVEMKNDITRFLIGTGPTKAMIALNNSKSSIPLSVSDLAKTIDITYSHTDKIVRKLKHSLLIKVVKSGRRNNVTLTDDGKTIAKLLSKMYDRLELIEK